MSERVDPGLAPRENRALVLGLLAALVAAASLGTWVVVHEGGRGRGAATGASSAPKLLRGERLYGLCASCHGTGGGGQLGRAPALLGSAWLAPDALARLVLHGFASPDAARYRERMVGAPALSDNDVAALVTFVGRRFAGRQDEATAEAVAEIRAATRGRTRPFTPAELRALPVTPAVRAEPEQDEEKDEEP